MDVKELLKLKLAEAVNGVDTSYAQQAREELQVILRHGSPGDVLLVKEAISKKAATVNLTAKHVARLRRVAKFKKNTKRVSEVSKDMGEVLKTLTTVGVVGGAALKGASKLKDAYKFHKMSPTKKALTKAFGKGTLGRKALGFGAGAAGIAGGIKGLEAISEGIATPIKKRSAFNKMIDDNPGLKKEDQRDVKRVFNTLFRFNPKMAGDPLVAGSFMKRTLQFKDEGIQPVDVKTLTEVSRNMSGNKSNSSLLSAAFLSGAKDLANFA